MGKNETKDSNSIANRIQALLDKRAAEDKELATELETEIDRLKNDLKTAAKNYKALTGKEVRFSIGPVATNGAPVETDGTKIPATKILILTELAGGNVLAQSEVASRIAARYPTANRSTITQTVSKLAGEGEVIEKSGEGVKITESGRKLVPATGI